MPYKAQWQEDILFTNAHKCMKTITLVTNTLFLNIHGYILRFAIVKNTYKYLGIDLLWSSVFKFVAFLHSLLHGVVVLALFSCNNQNVDNIFACIHILDKLRLYLPNHLPYSTEQYSF